MTVLLCDLHECRNLHHESAGYNHHCITGSERTRISASTASRSSVSLSTTLLLPLPGNKLPALALTLLVVLYH